MTESLMENPNFIQVPTINVIMSFDVVTFGLPEQAVKYMLDMIVSNIKQEIANRVGLPLFIGLDAGSLILPEYCYDGIYTFSLANTEQNETDLDCGGEKCKQCEIGGRCLWDSDCITLFCDKSSFTCSEVTGTYVSDKNEQIQWSLDNHPFDIFDVSPTINPYKSIFRSLNITP